jgi:peptide deformylase
MSAIDDIVLYPNDALKQECAPIEEITDDVRKLSQRMLKAMYASDGCGLAAPQVGELIQLVVIDVDYDGKKNRNPYVLINPVVVTADGEENIAGEGCLSFPGITVPVARPSHVVVRARNLDGALMQYEASNNLLCMCLQHEIDHLHGITMIDHLTLEQRSEAIAAYHEALEAGAKPGDVSVDD